MNVRQVIPRDAIPSVDDPTFTETYDGPDDDEVISLTVDRLFAFAWRDDHGTDAFYVG
ncbi:hypothetical protein GJR96_00955 [Haloferax sp. MBLA0076]|uniref:Uncharacterized protein n=1 Tax=Haloferax litoreum TaxID=2666140 RepID=A0A6A8GCJ8_9EURY|nr:MULTISPECIES: hypothetical protein [Haloferax]MRX20529.1 hypothetical protein [Haloferax litoreum]